MSQLRHILFAIRKPKCDDELSDSNSESSKDSGDLAHIPIANLDINLENLSLSEMQDQQNDQQMQRMFEGLAAQIQALNLTMQQMASKQQTQDNLLQNLSHASTPTTNAQPAIDIFRIPDPIKSIPSYDGSRRQLQSWVSSVENTLIIFKDLVNTQTYQIYVQAILNKITGAAKDAICLAGNPSDFDDVKSILVETFGDRQELATYKSQLWANKQSADMNIHRYYKRTREIVQNIKTIARQNAEYSAHWSAICKFIDEDALAAFIAGLKNPYFGYAQAAKPENIESAYAFLCKFTSAEKISAAQQYKHDQHRQISNQNKTNTSKETGRYQTCLQEYQNTNRNQNQAYHTKVEKLEHKPNVEKMEIDPSLRSRLTINRKSINNQEIESDDDETSDLEANFCTTPTTDTET